MLNKSIACLFLLVVSVHAFGQTDVRSISTSGSGEVRVVPDKVEVAVGVESVHANLRTAKSRNDQAVAALIEIAKRHGVAADNIQTDYISIAPAYEDRVVVSYTVQRSVVIVSHDIPGFERLLTSLVEAGANQVNSIRFMTSKLREHRDEARRMATRAALEKARLLAEGLGSRVGKVRNIHESQDYWSSSYWWWGRSSKISNSTQNAANAGGDSPEDGPLAPGRISVTASVSVTFDLE